MTDDVDALKRKYSDAVDNQAYARQQSNDPNTHKRADDAAAKANKDYTDAMMRQKSKTKAPNTGAAGDLLKMFGGQ